MEEKTPKTNSKIENGKETRPVDNKVEKVEKPKVKNLTDFISEETMPSDVLYSTYEQNRYFGSINVPPLTDGLFVNERFGYKKRYGCKEPHCTLLLDQKTGETVGILPPLALSKVWESAHNAKFSKPFPLKLTKEKWAEIKSQIEKYILANPKFKKSSKKLILVQDVFNVTEKEFEEMFIEQASEVVKLLRHAVNAEIKETANLKKRWHKIKKYPFKVPLEATFGGIFSKHDADILKKHGIHSLNDIHSKNVYYLKTLGLEYSFTYIIESINRAFKEDARRRWDTRFQVFPYTFGFLSTIACIIIGLIFKYTLIKNEPMTIVILCLLAVWLTLGVISIIIGVIRARYRRRSRPDYKYFTKPVKGRTVFLSLISVVAIGALFLFYFRYDGYDDTVYYRNLDDGTITVAGLFDEELTEVIVPSVIDGKTVVKIDRSSFYNQSIESIYVPATVKTIDRQAFYKAGELKYAYFYGAETVGEKAFDGCENLVYLSFGEGLVTIEKEAVAECKSLTNVDIPSTTKTIGEKAFYNCSSLSRIVDLTGVEEIKENAFEGCNMSSLSFRSLINVRKEAFKNCGNLDYVYASDTLEEIGDRAFMDCDDLTYVYNSDGTSIKLNGLKRIGSQAFQGCNINAFEGGDKLEFVGDEAFKDCGYLGEISFGTSVQEFGSNVFKSTTVTQLTLPYIGKTLASTKDYSLDYYGFDRVDTFVLNGSSTVYAKAFSGSVKPQNVSLFGVTSIESGTFKDNTSLKSIYIPQTVTSIADGVFEGCTSLSEIQGFEAVETIGSNAFKNCNSLRSINLQNITTIKSRAFEGCRLNNIGSFNSIETIGEGAFLNSLTLDSLVYNVQDGSVLTIGSKAFYGCDIDGLFISGRVSIQDYAFSTSQLNSVNLSNADILLMGEGVFANCSYLRSVGLPNNLTAIPASMLENVGIQDISIPVSVTKIGNKAFKNSSLYSIVLHDGIEEIGAEAYYGLDNITNIDVPNSVEFIGEGAFSDISGLTYINVPFLGTSRTSTNTGFVNVFGYVSSVQALYVNDVVSITQKSLDGANLINSIVINGSATTIGKGAFKDFDSKSISIPGSITSIQEQAFSGCEYLTEIGIPTSVKEIGNSAFQNCVALEFITLPNSLESLGASAFKNCYSLRSITIPEQIEVISAETFSGCSYMVTVEIEGYVVEIGNQAFSGCRNLLSINLPTTVKYIGNEAFYNCYSVSYVNLSASIESIGDSAFENCQSITTLTLANSLTQIGKKAFKNCIYIKSVIIPEKVKTIGEEAFVGCSKLENVTLPKTFKNSVDSIFPSGITFSYTE